jgi:uncharacterized protein YacL
MGLNPKGAPLELLAGIPSFVMNMNPKVALIGMMGLAIVVVYNFIKNPELKVIPAPMLMLMITVPIAIFLGIGEKGSYTFNDQFYELGEKFLVK